MERGLVKEYVVLNNSVPLDIVNDMINETSYANTYQARESFSFSFNAGEAICKNIFNSNFYVGRITIKNSGNNDNTVRYYKAILEQLRIYVEQLYKK